MVKKPNSPKPNSPTPKGHLSKGRIMQQFIAHQCGKSDLSVRFINYLCREYTGKGAGQKRTRKDPGFDGPVSGDRRKGQQVYINIEKKSEVAFRESEHGDRFGKQRITAFHRTHKQFGGFLASLPPQTISERGIITIQFKGKPLEVKFRKGDRGKKAYIFEFSKGLVFVDTRNNNLLGFVKPGDKSRIRG